MDGKEMGVVVEVAGRACQLQIGEGNWQKSVDGEDASIRETFA